MLTVAYVGEGGVKNYQNYAYVIYGCPLEFNFEQKKYRFFARIMLT